MSDPTLNAAMMVHAATEIGTWKARAEQAETECASLRRVVLTHFGEAHPPCRDRQPGSCVICDLLGTEVARNGSEEAAREAEAKAAALEARLAEVAPVVEAAERQTDTRPGDGPALTAEQRGHYDPEHLAMLAAKYPWLRATVDVENAVRALRAARARREASGA